MGRLELAGVIASAGFSSGDRFVVGVWDDGPLGPMVDVMWVRPTGERILLAPDEQVAAFVTAIYVFDRVKVCDFTLQRDRRRLALDAGTLSLRMTAGRAIALPVTRPAWFTRWVEGPIARSLLRVHTYGTSPTGVHEWYRARSFRPLTWAQATLDGTDLGEVGPLQPALRVGVSEPPRWPSMVEVAPLLEDPSGDLEQRARQWRAARAT